MVDAKRPTGKFDYRLRAKVESTKQEISTLEKLQYLYSSNDEKYAFLSNVEKAKRMKVLEAILKEWKEKNSDLGSRSGNVNSSETEGKPTLDFKPTKVDLEKGTDGELVNTRGQDSAMLLQQQKNMLEGQDRALEKISDVVDGIKYENQQFAGEVKMQNKMLDTVNDELDKNNDNMVKLDSKLRNMLAKGSICKLWVIIIIEIALFCFLLSAIP